MGTVNWLSHSGYIAVVNNSNGDQTLISLIAGTLAVVGGSSQIGVTKDEATNINVYIESNVLKIQNTYGTAQNVKVLFWGASFK
jgi:hypothetical protein